MCIRNVKREMSQIYLWIRNSQPSLTEWLLGRGWRTGCGSQSQNADQVEEREESDWRLVRQKNEREYEGEVYRTVVRPALVYGADTLKKAQEKKL